MNKYRGFTLLEVMVAITILGLMAATVVLVIKPFDRIEDSQYAQALSELQSIGQAVGYFAADYGYFPDDVSRNLPSGIEEYLTADESWPSGPLPGSVYDYDNWLNKTCLDPEASGSIQVTLRQVPGRNPDGSDVWAWYYVLQGNGTPHCDNAEEATKGECVNCPGFEL